MFPALKERLVHEVFHRKYISEVFCSLCELDIARHPLRKGFRDT